MIISPFAAFNVHLHPIRKELDRCWSCVSLSNTAPAASVQPATSDGHFEAKLFEQVHLGRMKGARDCFPFPLFVAAFLNGKSKSFFFLFTQQTTFVLVVWSFVLFGIIIQHLATSSVLTSLQEQHSHQPTPTQVSQPEGHFIQLYKHNAMSAPCWLEFRLADVISRGCVWDGPFLSMQHVPHQLLLFGLLNSQL